MKKTGFLMLRGFSRIAGILSVFSCVLTLASSAGAVTMTFEGIGSPSGVPVLNFYNGGAGPNFGVEFSSTASAFTEGQYANNPSPGTNILAASTIPLKITGSVAAGFTDEFSFFYANDNVGPHTMSLFESLDGAGMALFSLTLPSNGSAVGGPAFSVWTQCGPTSIACNIPSLASFVDKPHSFVFEGGFGTGQLGLDNITLTPVPEPSTALLLGLGLASLAAAGRRVRPASV